MSGEQSIHKKGRFSMMNPADHGDWSGVMSAGVTSLLAGVFLLSNAREFGHEIKGGNDLDKEEWKLSTEQKKKHFFKQTLLIALADVLNWMDGQLLYLDAPKRVHL